jgi:septum formation protein
LASHGKILAVKERPIILASGSPRRQEILSSLCLPLTIVPSEIDETQFRSGSAFEHVKKLAELKASEVAQRLNSGLVIGADTVVVIDDQILEKPRDVADAHEMLNRLSGRWHEVLTGVCLIKPETGDRRSGCEITKVKFASLQPDEVKWYIATGEPMDKAGAYAIQGYGALFIERIEGDYLNVVGLPLRLVYCLAAALGVDLKSDLTRAGGGEPA